VLAGGSSEFFDEEEKKNDGRAAVEGAVRACWPAGRRSSSTKRSI
jgi:hypothetical protein